jgi:methylthioribose-1-phosphate isomerase
MDTLDERLPFLLRRENVARYEDGVVIIGDRRKYPFERAYVRCEDVESVARAIEGMVTQGGGPSVAALYAMVMAARAVEGKPSEVARAHLRQAAARLGATRPTNTSLHRQLAKALAVAEDALNAGSPVAATLLDWIDRVRGEYYANALKIARFGADLIGEGDGILTMCFAETTFILSLLLAHEAHKEIQVYTPETRPYLQGARLTAPCIHELGIPVKVITDNMPAYLMSQGKIQKYFTAADLVTMDGHVVNKVGTFQNALAAHYHGIPFFVFSHGPDPHCPDRASIIIEERDPAEVRVCRHVPTTLAEIDAYYPAFDITPPHLVAGVITEHGVLSPYSLARYYGPAVQS